MTHKRINDILVLKPKSYLDVEFKKEVVPLVKSYFADGAKKILFDLEDVELINSHGISGLLSIYDETSTKKGILAFCSIKALMVENAFQVSGLAEFCKKHVYDTEEAALEALAA